MGSTRAQKASPLQPTSRAKRSSHHTAPKHVSSRIPSCAASAPQCKKDTAMHQGAALTLHMLRYLGVVLGVAL